MDELALANVNAYMAERASHGVEKYQIAGFEFFFGNGGGGGRLIGCAARQHVAARFLESGPNKTAAVKAGFGRGAAIAVVHPQKGHGLTNQIGCGRAHTVTRLLKLSEHAVVLGQEFIQFVVLWRGVGTRYACRCDAACDQQFLHGAGV